MSLRIVTCSFCRGSGQAESLEEQTDTGQWVPNTALDHGIADAWIQSDPWAPLRWTTSPCPVCHGSGSLDVEHVTCKIF